MTKSGKRVRRVAKPKKDKNDTIQIISRNRAARHNYFIDETFEAGIVLTGAEVCSLRERPAQLTDTFIVVRNGEVWLNGMHIHPYLRGGVWNPDPDRRRKLLLHKRQIRYLDQKLRVKGAAIVPLQMYFDEHNRVKLTIALGKGKKLYDKRADMAKRDSDREIQRAMKQRSRRVCL